MRQPSLARRRTRRYETGTAKPVLCGLVMAGGEGKRLRPFVHLLRGDLLPKQYVAFIGARSMLEHTLARAEKLIPAERVFTVINEPHLSHPEVKRQLSRRPPGTVIVQPANKETAPGLLLPLMHLHKRYPNSTVTLFPSDHFVLEEDQLSHHVDLATLLVRQDPSRLVLLGVAPDSDEPEYGYMVPGKKHHGAAADAFHISRFVEKPELQAVRDLIDSGALWNTMLMVFNTATLLAHFSDLTPALHRNFKRIYDAIGTAREPEIVHDVYRQLDSVNLSKELLEPLARTGSGSLLALLVRDVLWSDWGTETRVMEMLRKTGHVSRLNGMPKPLAARAAAPRKSSSLPCEPVARNVVA